MVNVELKFPILGIKENNSNIYVFQNHIGIISKGGNNFYKKLWICDSIGNTFLLKKSILKEKVHLNIV